MTLAKSFSRMTLSSTTNPAKALLKKQSFKQRLFKRKSLKTHKSMQAAQQEQLTQKKSAPPSSLPRDPRVSVPTPSCQYAPPGSSPKKNPLSRQEPQARSQDTNIASLLVANSSHPSAEVAVYVQRVAHDTFLLSWVLSPSSRLLGCNEAVDNLNKWGLYKCCWRMR